MIGRIITSFILIILTVNSGIGSQQQEQSDQQPAPAAGPIPPVYYDSLLNGLQILIVERPGTPKVSVGFMIKSGAAFDLVGREGTADLTARLVLRGSQTVSNRSLARLLQDLDVAADVSVTWDATRFSFDVPPQNLVHLFPTLAEILLRPSFPADALAALKQQRRAQLQQRRLSPSDLAATEFSRQVFARHPYARPVEGTIASLENIRPADIARHYRRFYLANNAVLTVVGNVSAETLMPLIRPTFGALRRGKIVPATFTAPRKPAGIDIKVVDQPDTDQATIWMGNLAVARGSDEFIPLQLLNYALGGTPHSQLARLAHALYPEPVGFASHLDARALLGSFAISATSRGRFASGAISTLLKFIETIRRQGITDADLIAAKQHFIEEFPQRLRTNRQIVDQLQDIELYGLGRDSIVSFVHYIEQVTPEQVKRVAEKVLSNTHLYIVVTGPAAEMVEELKAIGTVAVAR